MLGLGRERIEYKTPEQVRVMRRAGLVVAEALAAVREAARPGMSTADLDDVASDAIRGAGATPSFLGYEGFPATICVSVGDEVIHGIPGGRVLGVGDLVSVDCGAIVDGWHGDSAVSFLLGDTGALPADAPDDVVEAAGGSAAHAGLVRATEAAMWAGIAALDGGRRLNDVGRAVEASVELAGGLVGAEYGIVEEYVGHGIGTAMHQPPDVVNYRVRDAGPRLRPGMCLAIEPMVTLGSGDTHVLDDGWTVVTADGSRAAHWEHSVALLDGGICVLTAPDGGAARLGELGVDVVPLD
ncbi:type I methionyl aminopeptidase [Myceligenerans indicum]|uniref:Methionine aminopeptidase n=1 Tax=Myceligenerans indicum TaxID=2593663 RepID=A0ABS1LH27_9MICO|nr:type I methionyl aminopeptidase [Myceligenerans indicum]MBL0885354.1 type I methionyl aminopeptidase [Myceligenerans indicum]